MGLGELQQLTMLAVARLRTGAYGAAVKDELSDVAGRRVSVPTVYVTLIRLEEQGLVRSTQEPRPDGRAGRARRVFELTPSGWDVLREARAAADRMWRGVVQP